MNERHRQKLEENQLQLKEMIMFDELLPALKRCKIFSFDMLADIENAGPTQQDKNNKMLSSLPKRGPEAYEKFVHCLVDSDQLVPARLLNDIIPDAGVWQGTVVPAARFCGTDKDKIYPMKSNPRGVALIISIIQFENNNKPERHGGSIDEENLLRLFQYLGFIVDLHRNKNEMEIRTILQDFKNDPRHLSADACFVVILSHGCEKGFNSYDASSISNEAVLQMFNNINCPFLRNKPKVFFFQHCRGDEFDYSIPSVPGPIDTDSDAVDLPRQTTLATWTDMKICYSTSPNTVSLRSSESGTLFIATLVDVFSQHAHEMHLDDLLEEITNRLLQLEVYGWKQSPEYTSRGWRRKLYFNPGLTQTE